MNILNKLSIKNLKLNKKRTISTIIGIILSTALICAVATMATSFKASLVQDAINQTGYYHIKLYDINDEDYESLKNNRDIGDLFRINHVGYSNLEESQNEYKPYLKLYSMDEKVFEKLKFKLLEGSFPKNSDEIIISSHIKTNGNVDYNIGDKIKLNIGNRTTIDGKYDLNTGNPYNEGEEKLVDTYEKEFTVVGIIERPDYSFEDYSEAGYTVITTNMDKGKVDVYIALKNPIKYQTSIAELLGAVDYNEVISNTGNFKYDNYYINDSVLYWEALSFSLSTMQMIYSVCAVVIFIIIFTSVFCIRNSFAIATTEKIKMYGMLASIGATKKQIKKNVISEAMLLGIIGIPLGILSGIFAAFVLLRITNYFIGDEFFIYIDGIIFKISFLAILLSVLLGFVTIYLSAKSSAKKASKVSPIESLRNTNEIKIKNKNLKTPKIIKVLFGTGGVLAYKNLKRSKKKYRTTVISLTVSIAIFITMNSFVNYAFGTANNYYKDYDYNISIRENSESSLTTEDMEKISSLDNIDEKYIVYWDDKNYIKIKDLDNIKLKNSLTEEIAINEETGEAYINETTGEPIYTGEKYSSLQIMALDDESFKQYAKKIGENYEKIKYSGILCDTYTIYIAESNSYKKEKVYNYAVNDTIKGEYKENEVSINVGATTEQMPYGYEGSSFEGGVLVVNYNEYKDKFDFNNNKRILIQSNNPDKLTEEINNLNLDINCTNYEEIAQSDKQYLIIVSIFLYGFITVITLIGVTNIFNTITSNMELRQKEFAMLKSVGMTKKEFNRMINLETLMYSTKSLIYGVLLGILGTFAMYKAFAIKVDSGINIPISAIIISIVFVFVLVYIIMKYSIKKINKQNTIETIRKENI